MHLSWTSLLTSAVTLSSIGVLLVAAWQDIATRRVANWLAIVLALLGIVQRAATGTLLFGLLAGVIMFVLTALCWRRGWLGGADVKLLAAATIIVPPYQLPTFLGAVGITGALLALLYITARFISPAPSPSRSDHLLARAWRAERWRVRRGGPLPYACAIAGGFLFVVLQPGVS
jgi:prepilin peptidase CpaA